MIGRGSQHEPVDPALRHGPGDSPRLVPAIHPAGGTEVLPMVGPFASVYDAAMKKNTAVIQQDNSALRRHLYFYMFLLLATLVANAFKHWLL